APRLPCADRAHPPALLSFPPRRSSDLLIVVHAMTSDPDAGRIGNEVVARRVKERIAPSPKQVQALRDSASLLSKRMEDWAKRLEDRKSTRLNSSHRTISYAVFCLKKKT